MISRRPAGPPVAHSRHAPVSWHLEDTHLADSALAVVTFVLGAAGLLAAALSSPMPAAWLGAVGVMTGLWGQMVSRTTSERFLDVIGLVAAAVAFGLGAAAGGFAPAG